MLGLSNGVKDLNETSWFDGGKSDVDQDMESEEAFDVAFGFCHPCGGDDVSRI